MALTPFYNAEGAFIANATSPAEKIAGIASFQTNFSQF